MPKLSKYESFRIAATLLSGSESFKGISSNKNRVSSLLSLAKEIEIRQDEDTKPEEKQVGMLDIL